MSRKKKLSDGSEIVVYVYPISRSENVSYDADTIKVDGSLDRWVPGTAEYKEHMRFSSKEAAIRYAREHFLGKEFFVRQQWPPTPPNCEWTTKLLHHEKTIVYHSTQ